MTETSGRIALVNGPLRWYCRRIITADLISSAPFCRIVNFMPTLTEKLLNSGLRNTWEY